MGTNMNGLIDAYKANIQTLRDCNGVERSRRLNLYPYKGVLVERSGEVELWTNVSGPPTPNNHVVARKWDYCTMIEQVIVRSLDILSQKELPLD